MKQRMQGTIMGALAMVLLLGTITVHAAATRNIEVTVGTVRTTIFGQEFVVRDEQGIVIEPFVYNGRAFVPVDTVLHAMGVNAQWDEVTSTLNFGTTEQPPDTQLVPSKREGMAFFANFEPFQRGGYWANRLVIGTVQSLGLHYANTLFHNHAGGVRNYRLGGTWVDYNLNGQHTRLSGTILRIDGRGDAICSISFFGDGRELLTVTTNENDQPLPISIDLTGVMILRIQTNTNRSAFTNAIIY